LLAHFKTDVHYYTPVEIPGKMQRVAEVAIKHGCREVRPPPEMRRLEVGDERA
jgi:hypothetical protein